MESSSFSKYNTCSPSDVSSKWSNGEKSKGVSNGVSPSYFSNINWRWLSNSFNFIFKYFSIDLLVSSLVILLYFIWNVWLSTILILTFKSFSIKSTSNKIKLVSSTILKSKKF